MITECNVKTVTEIQDNKILISCVSFENQEERDKPTLFRADLLEGSKTINSEGGIEGELLLTHVDSNETVGELDEDGNLIITLNDDDVNEYYVDNDGQLKYGQQNI